MAPRLRTELRVQARIRQCATAGVTAVLVRRGDPDAGAVLLKVNGFQAGCRVYARVTTGLGEPGWAAGTGADPVPEPDADAYISRQVSRDPDLWVVEIEDPHGRFVLDEPLV